MVQLKSFRYLETEDETGSSGQSMIETPQPQQHQPNQHQHQNQHQQSRSPSSSSTASSSNMSSLASGGNLTLTGAEESASLHSNANANLFNQPTSLTTREDSPTLGSNEEYQVANHDIIEEEDEEAGELENEAPALVAVRSELELEQQNGLATENRPLPPLRMPLSPRVGHSNKHHQYFRSNSAGVGSPKVLKHSMSSHSLSKQNADSISQYSFNQRNVNPLNSFEIRWHNINLHTTTKSSVFPKFVTDTTLYKTFLGNKRSSAAGKQAESVIHSPALNIHKFAPPGKRSIGTDATGSVISEKGLDPAFVSINETPNSGDDCFGRTILNNVSGAVLSGQLTAILGPSGVGKTTLLNSLTGRNTLEGSGQVLLLGAGANTKRMSVVTVPQTDILPGKLTALEDLQFTSRLKNPQRGFEHRRNIDKIVKHLHMEKFLNTRIDKLSGGEARRLSIGRELLSSPDIMILDEPTSGLDANTCKKIITALRDIVVHSDNILDRPMAIIVTIHQPQQEVFNLFHRVYVMAQGGRSIYEGPPTSLLSTFLEYSSINRVCPVDQLNENPAIVAIEVASGEFGQNVINELALNHETQMYEEYACSVAGTPISTPRTGGKQQMSPLSLGTPRFNHLRHHHPRLKSPRTSESISLGRPTPVLPIKRLIQQQQQQQFDNLSTLTSLSYASTYDAELPELASHLKVDKRLRRSVVMKGDFLSHTFTLMQRCWLLTTRDLFLMFIRIIGFLLVAVGIVQIFSHALDINENQCPLYETEVVDIMDFMTNIKSRLMNMSNQLKQASATHLFFFHLVLCITIVTSALTGLVFPMQIRMFIREYKNGWYSPASFITSLTLAELPIDIIGPTITMLITYPLCNQPASAYHWREACYILVIGITSVITKSQAQIVGAILMDSVENSVFMACVMVTPPALLSGVAVRIPSMSWLLQLASYFSFLRYNLESLFVIRYGYDMCPCDPELVYGYPANTSLDAIPPQLNRMLQGFLELNSPETPTSAINSTNTTYNLVTTLGGTNENQTLALIEAGDPENGNLILKFIRLVSNSGNQFLAKLEDLGDCSKYRSLYLIDMGIDDRILFKWVSVMIFIYIVSRFLTYFVVKTVIKFRKGT